MQCFNSDSLYQYKIIYAEFLVQIITFAYPFQFWGKKECLLTRMPHLKCIKLVTCVQVISHLKCITCFHVSLATPEKLNLHVKTKGG